MKKKVILDTNVLVSALISKGNYLDFVLSYLLFGDFEILVSDEIFDEYLNVCSREKFKKFGEFSKRSAKILDEIKDLAAVFNPKNKTNYLKDKSDNKFIDLAIEAGADIITTGNIKDFDLVMNKFDFEILSPKEFYEKYHK